MAPAKGTPGRKRAAEKAVPIQNLHESFEVPDEVVLVHEAPDNELRNTSQPI